MGHFPTSCPERPEYVAKTAAQTHSEWLDPTRKLSQTLDEKRSQVEQRAVIAGLKSGVTGFAVSSVAVGLLNNFHAGFRGVYPDHGTPSGQS